MSNAVCCLLLLAACPIRVQGADPVGRARWLHELQDVLPAFEVRAEEIQPDDDAVYGTPSPDGRWLVKRRAYPAKLDAGGIEPWGLRLYDDKGRFIRDLTNPRFYLVLGYQWSQTGDALLFWSDFGREDERGIWKLDLRNNSSFRPHLPWYPGALPIWSPRGNTYLLTITDERRADVDRQGIYRVEPGSKRTVTRLAAGSGPVWSPDGRAIAFQKHAIQRGVVQSQWWVTSADGTRQRLLMSDQVLTREARKRGWMKASISVPAAWTPDSSRLLVRVSLSDEAGQRYTGGTLVVDTSGRTLRLVLGLSLVSASRDGRRLYAYDQSKKTTSGKQGTDQYYRITLIPRHRE